MKKKITIAVLILALLLPVHVAAQTPVGVAVIGDSISHEYRCVQRGNSTTFNWVEIAERLRGVNFGFKTGNCYEYDHAWSGNTITYNMASMVGYTLADPSEVEKVVIWLGYNDIAGGASVSSLIATYTAQLDRLLTRFEPQNILLVAVPQADCGDNNASITNFNSQLQALATSKGTAFAPYSNYCNLLNSYASGQNAYNYGGQNVNRWSWCYVSCIRIPDGHPGNIAQAIFLNSLLASFLEMEPVTEAEVLAMMGIGSAATNTPSKTPTATLTRTPRATATITHTPTITSTPSPIFVMPCPNGYHIGEVVSSTTVRCDPD